MSEVAPPRAPQRQSTLDADGVPDEPPPAYSARPDDQVVESGPRYPFGFTDHEPVQPQHTSSSQFAPPPQHPHSVYQQTPSTYSSYSRPPLPGTVAQVNGYGPFDSPPPQTPHHTGGSSSAGRSSGSREEPTRTPLPGRVLMHAGKVLVYPREYTCPKCHNTGFKDAAGRNPHTACWDRYGKPWNVVRVSPEGTSYSQRPLPGSSSSSRPPSSAPRPPSQQWSPPPHPPQQQFSPPPQQPYYPQQWSGAPPQPHYSAYSPAPTQPFVNRPPPNALVVQAGDPRIGGQLCLNCNGRGFITSGIGFLGMGFEDTCGRCRGTGRVF